MRHTLFIGASATAILMPSIAFAMDVKISGNVTIDMSVKDEINAGASAAVSSTGTNISAITAAATTALNNATGAAVSLSPTAWYVDDNVTGGDDWKGTTSGDIDVAVSSKNCCFSYGGNLGLAMSMTDGTSVVKTDDANIYINSATFGRIEFGIDADGKQGAFDRDVLAVGPATLGLDVWNKHQNDQATAIANSLTNSVVTTNVTLGTATIVSVATAELKDAFTTSSVSGTAVEWSHSLAGFTVAAAADLGGDDSGWEASLGYQLNLAGQQLALVGALTSNDSYALRAKTSVSGVDLVAGYAADDDDETSLYFGASTTVAGFGLSAEVAKNEAKATTTQSITQSAGSVTIAGFGPIPISAVNSTVSGVHESDDTQVALNASYALAPGLVLSGGVKMYDLKTTGQFKTSTDATGVADSNVSFSNSLDGRELHARLKLTF